MLKSRKNHRDETNEHARQQAREFLSANRAAALATSDAAGTPQVSIVYCIVGDDLKIYFSTRVEGRKFINLMARPSVSMAFYDESRLQSIQLSGAAQRIEDLDREQDIMGKLMRLRYGDMNWPVPVIQLFERGATNEIAVIEVVPSEMTFANFSTPRTGKFKPAFQKII